MQTLRILCAVALAATNAACASLYIHDAGLAEDAASVRSVVDGADLLGPYDQRITALSALSEREDRAVLEFTVAERDAQLALLAVAPDGRGPNARPALVRALLSDDWTSLTGAAPSAGNLLRQLEEIDTVAAGELNARDRRYSANGILNEARREYLEDVRVAGGRPRGLNCDDVQALSAQIIAEEPGAEHLLAIRAACADLDEGDDQDPYARVGEGLRRGELGAAMEAERNAQALVSAARAKPVLDAIDRELAAATEAAESSATARAAALEAELGRRVEQGSSIAEFFRWSRMEAELDRVERALTCRAPDKAVSEEDRKAANCDGIEGATTENKTRVLLAFAQAIGGLEDAQDDAMRSAHWLRAARAIVSARKEAARLRLNHDRDLLASYRQRTRALLAQAEADAYGLIAIGGRASECSGSRTTCAIQAYVESVDRGSAPARVLEQRPTQADRLLSAQLARLAAQTDAELIRAAAGQLDEYGKGGIEPALIARILVELGLIGAVSNE